MVTRVQLTTDHSDEFGQTWITGQTGTVVSLDALKQPDVVVDFDGYEMARKKQEEFLAKKGEGFNILPWLALVPTWKLRKI